MVNPDMFEEEDSNSSWKDKIMLKCIYIREWFYSKLGG